MYARIRNKLYDVQVDDMIENIKKVVSDTLSGLHWMDDMSLEAAKAKVDCSLTAYIVSLCSALKT